MYAPTFLAFPELRKYQDRIYFIGCGPSYSFYQTDNVTIIKRANQGIQSGKDIVIFYDLSEPVSTNAIKKVNSIAKDLVTPQSKILYLTASYDGKKSYQDICKKLMIPALDIQILSSNIYLHVVQQSIEPKPYEVSLKSKKFLTFNKNHRIHRAILIAKLIEKNMLDLGYCSMYGSWGCSNWIDQLEPFLNKFDPKLFVLLKKNEHLFPLHLNANGHSRGNPITNDPQDMLYYDDSYYSIVTETTFFSENLDFASEHMDTGFLVSEKTYKPIAAKHPFIMMSCAGFLQLLRDMGYKTFHPYINESYDLETDDRKRLNMIVDEIERLNSFTDSEWIDWQQQIETIVNYNYQHFRNSTQYGITKNINID